MGKIRQDAGELSAAQLVHGISALTIRRQTRVPLILLGCAAGEPHGIPEKHPDLQLDFLQNWGMIIYPLVI